MATFIHFLKFFQGHGYSIGYDYTFLEKIPSLRLFDSLRLFNSLEYIKILSSNLGRTCCVQKLFLAFRKIFVHNMFSPCSAKRRVSDKDLPILLKEPFLVFFKTCPILLFCPWVSLLSKLSYKKVSDIHHRVKKMRWHHGWFSEIKL